MMPIELHEQVLVGIGSSSKNIKKKWQMMANGVPEYACSLVLPDYLYKADFCKGHGDKD